MFSRIFHPLHLAAPVAQVWKPALRLAATTFLCLFIGATAEAAEDSALRKLKPFLEKNCHACHGPEKQKHDLRFDTLGHDLSHVETLRTWQDILDQLNLGEMPPPKKPQPPASEVAGFTKVLTARLDEAHAKRRSTGGSTVLRRLNRAELRNTLRDLLYLDGPDFRSPTVGPEIVDPSGSGAVINVATGVEREFPEDEKLHGFDNIGQKLVTSDFLLKLVIGAAEDALGRATIKGEKPKTEARRFAGPVRKDPNGVFGNILKNLKPGYDGIFELYIEPDSGIGGVGRVSPSAMGGTGVGVSARYRITIEASAHNQHSWGELIDTRENDPLMLGLHRANVRRGSGFSAGSPTDTPVVQWPMTADGKTRTFVHEMWLNSTWTAWVGWENAPHGRTIRPAEIVEKALPAAFRPRPPNNAPEKEKQDYQAEMAKALFGDDGYMGPHVRIHSMTFEPLIDQWPPRSHALIHGTKGTESTAELLLNFAQRAYRSPVLPADVACYVELVEAQLARGLTCAEALRMGYTAVLASPRFYYLQETEGPLNGYQLASRLSYFLWSSMPDEELFALAANGKIKKPAVLRAQVERMLNHENATAFTRRFVTSWLRLDKLGTMAPDLLGPFRCYYDRHLQPLMAEETDLYFATLLKNNGPIRELIDSDYTFMNERTAQYLYNRSDDFNPPKSVDDYYPKYVKGGFMRRVKLRDPRRGGIIVQPSVMTATANGVDTSPVIRGVWVLESILGTPPSPPPPDVPPLSPDLRGAKTIREQLEAHRKSDACFSCHKKIDPMGFAFENFDPIGRWRDNYPIGNKKIDPSAELPNGEPLADIVALKKYLLTRESQVTRNLCEKLVSYGTGRMIERTDRAEVDQMVRQLREKNGGLRDLVHLVVQSKAFATK